MSVKWFPRLPPEIQLRIWKFALPGPRVITLSSSSDYTTLFARDPENIYLDALCYACIDSRKMIKEAGYRRQFRERIGKSVWFNTDIDTLCFSDHSAQGIFIRENILSGYVHLPPPIPIPVKHILIGYAVDKFVDRLLDVAPRGYNRVLEIHLAIVGFIAFGLLFSELKELTFVIGPDEKINSHLVNQVFDIRAQYLGFPFLKDFGMNVLEKIKFKFLREENLGDRETWPTSSWAYPAHTYHTAGWNILTKPLK